MGILDEAIRDHLELKRRGGVQEADLKRLEDEAFGPPSRPGDPTAAVIAPAQAPEAPKAEPPAPAEPEEASAADQPGGESSPVAPEATPPDANGADSAAPEGGGAFHDFAAEEGLVSPGEDPAVEEHPAVEEPHPAVEEPPREPPPPAQEASLDDTQPHDMATELGATEEPTPPPEQTPAADELEIADEDLELQLEDDEDAPPSGNLSVVEEDEELVIEDVEVEEVVEGDDEGDDVLEETPDFLRETPEHDRLWFEQRPPKDFDFDGD